MSAASVISRSVHNAPGLFFAFLVLVLLFAFSLHKVINLDIGWHIKAGDYIVTNWKVPGLDIFSYTAADRPYLDSHWLFQVVVYTVYAVAGVYGLNLLVVLVTGAVFIILFRSTGFLDKPYTASYFFFLAILAGSDRFMIRPELFTFLFCATYLYILHKHGCGRKLYLLPLLQILWVNMHGLFVLGLVMVLCYMAGGLAAWKLKLPFEWNSQGALDRKGFLRLVLVFGLMVLASFVNPYGYRLAFYPVTLFTEVSRAGNVVGASVTELLSPFSGSPLLNRESLIFYKLLAVSSLLTFLLNYRRVNLSHVLLYSAFFYLSTLAVRNIILFAIVAVPFSVFNLEGILAGRMVLKGGAFESALKYTALAVLVLVTGYYLASLYSNDYYLRNGRLTRTGPGLSEVRYPEGAIDFVQRNGIKGNVFNSPGLGGYFIWRSFPRQKVFFDGRWEVYGDDFFERYNTVLNNPDYFNFMAKSYGVNYALVEHSSGFPLLLYRDPAWVIVYCDDVAAVFVKNTARNQKAIDSARCDLETGAKTDAGAIERTYLGRIDEGFLARTMRLARLFREGFDPQRHFNRGSFFNVMGLKDRAEEEFLRSLAMYPHQQTAHFNLGLVYLDQGKIDRAAREFEFVLELNPRNEMARKFLVFLGRKK
jgi:tetratricopeptide (TPR) repeat protein